MPPPDQPHSLRQALEDAIAANPDDLVNHAAYADWLAEQPDPADQARGEFVRVQLALEDPAVPAAERQRLQRREAELLAAHQRDWLGGLAPYLLDNEQLGYAHLYGFDHVGEFHFRRGWLDHLRICYLSVPLARALRDAPETRALQSLVVEAAGDDYPEGVDPEPGDNVPEGEHSRALCPLLGSPHLGNVRRLRLGLEPEDDYQKYSCHFHGTAPAKLVGRMPLLEELRLFANGFDLDDLFTLPTLTHLRVLQVYHAVEVHRLHLLAENPAFRNLTHLLLHPHHIAWWQNDDKDSPDGYLPAGGYLPLSVVRPLLTSENLPHLTHLRLRVSSLGDEGCEEIVRSGILKRLKWLDLRHGRITDRGAAVLAACPDLKRLEWLDLDRNVLSEEGVRRVKSVGIPVRVDDQHPPPDPEEVFNDEEMDDIDAEELYPYLCEGEFE